jgi:hemerythrin
MEETHVWSQKLDLGLEALDREHHLQVALVSSLADAMEQRRPRLARRLLEQLAGYSKSHFSGEELLMQLAGYQLVGRHRQEHQAMLSEIEEIRYLHERGEYDLAVPMVMDLLNGLAAHIFASDRRFTEYSEQACVTGAALSGS